MSDKQDEARALDSTVSHNPSLLNMLVIQGNIRTIRTECTYVNKRLINCSPKYQWKGSSEQYHMKKC